MSAIPKKRLCWNCHGEVPMVVQTCPYCGVYVEQTAPGVQTDEHEPPYHFKASGDMSIPASPFASEEDLSHQNAISTGSEATTVALNDAKSVLFPVLFLLTGSVFFLFGLVIALFSEEGVLTLSWNGEYWFAYLNRGPCLPTFWLESLTRH